MGVGEHRPYLLPAPLSDSDAAALVDAHFSRRLWNEHQLAAEASLIRLLLSSPLRETSLWPVLDWLDVLFFDGLVCPRVQLCWLPAEHGSYWSDIIGTTELRPSCRREGGFETRILLSRRPLQNEHCDQRLVLAALIHEAIHAYLFIQRGFEARRDGGHTPGFGRIAALIDDWIGDENYLRLRHVEAALSCFQTERGHGWCGTTATWGQPHEARLMKTIPKPERQLQPRRRKRGRRLLGFA